MFDVSLISRQLKLAYNGIWYPDTKIEDVSYPDDGHQSNFSLEQSSFWFCHRNRCIASLVTQLPPTDEGPIFDIGGGNGIVSLALAKAGFETVLLEPSPVGAANAKQRGLENVICATTDSAGFSPGSLPAIGLFDVVEHIKDDLSFLQSCHRLLADNGKFYLTVPAYNFLWSAEDEFTGHYRRYDRNSISRVLRDAGFDIDYAGYIFYFLPLPLFLLRALPFKLGMVRAQRRQSKDNRDHVTGSRTIQSIISMALKPELSKLKKLRSMPFGGSVLVAASKR